MEHLAKTQTLIDLVGAVVSGSVSLPDDRVYYINYRLYTNTWVVDRWVDTDEEIHIGPYPLVVAQFIAKDIVPNIARYGKGLNQYVSKPTLSLKPRKNSIKRTGPTQEEIERLLLRRMNHELDIYRRVQEWFSLSYVPSQTTKKEK